MLRSIRYGEADRVLHLYSATRGRIGAIAKGVRRPRSRFGGRLEPFFRLDLVLHEGRGELSTVTAAHTIAAHPEPARRRRRARRRRARLRRGAPPLRHRGGRTRPPTTCSAATWRSSTAPSRSAATAPATARRDWRPRSPSGSSSRCRPASPPSSAPARAAARATGSPASPAPPAASSATPAAASRSRARRTGSWSRRSAARSPRRRTPAPGRCARPSARSARRSSTTRTSSFAPRPSASRGALGEDRRMAGEDRSARTSAAPSCSRPSAGPRGSPTRACRRSLRDRLHGSVATTSGSRSGSRSPPGPLITVFRLVRREPLQFALAGFAGVALSAFIADRTGGPRTSSSRAAAERRLRGPLPDLDRRSAGRCSA